METAARVVAVASGSPAAEAGILPGDELLTLNGEAPRDVVRYQWLADSARLDVAVRTDGIARTIRVEKNEGEPLGLELESAVFDRVQTCDNHCPFCFIYQLPPGMRRTLYLKDDDYRLSFLYGNFTTLTRFTEADLERTVTERLDPLYVSIHATEPGLRSRLLRNRRGATSLRWLRLLLDHGLEVHGQIVVCPGLNDGRFLDETLLGILDRFPDLATVAVVPVGVSDHSHEPEIRPMTAGEAIVTLDSVRRWQDRFIAAVGRRMVFAADELYLLAGAPLPDLDEYEALSQHENGVGMGRAFETEVRARLEGRAVEPLGVRDGFFAWVEGARPDGYRAPGGDGVAVSLRTRPGTERAPVAIVTGEYGARILEPLLGELSSHAGVPVRVLPVPNRFFGGNIAVTGLLTSVDIASVLDGAPPGDRYLIPDVVLSRGQFLDGGTVADLPHPVEVVKTDGVALVDALTP